jgi:hypothetical protein
MAHWNCDIDEGGDQRRVQKKALKRIFVDRGMNICIPHAFATIPILWIEGQSDSRH